MDKYFWVQIPIFVLNFAQNECGLVSGLILQVYYPWHLLEHDDELSFKTHLTPLKTDCFSAANVKFYVVACKECWYF